MPLELGDRTAVLIGELTVDDIEPLVSWLRRTRAPKVNLRRCTKLHTGALQALFVFGAKVSAPPADHFLACHVMPLLTRRNPAGTEAIPVASAVAGAPGASA